MSSKTSDNSTPVAPRVDELRDLNPRSLALSALLGTHPPALPTRALVALAELFGIAGGTMRTAISRMAASGEIVSEDGWHRLEGRLLDRQRAQDVGRRSPVGNWDGRWHTVVASDGQRALAERRRFRTTLTEHRFGELRPDIWMRPANLPAPAGDRELGALVLTGVLDGDGGTAASFGLAGRLWPLGELAERAGRLRDRIASIRSDADLDEASSIPPTFVVAASVLRFLRSEPMLPAELTPSRWPVDALRADYERLEADLQRALRAFLGGHRS